MTIERDNLKRLILSAVFRLVSGTVIISAMLFGAAGTLHYWEGWLYLGVLLLPTVVFLQFMIRKDPELLERRLRIRERETVQKAVILGSIPLHIALLLIPPLDHRFGWSAVPPWVIFVSAIAILAGYLLYVRVLMVNRFASRTIAIEAGQKLVTTGPYRIVRHPLYLAGVLMFATTPLALGSFWGLITAPGIVVIYVVRILNEETVLIRGLDGYEDYRRLVRWRLVPGVW